jgi:hypothetical protein
MLHAAVLLLAICAQLTHADDAHEREQGIRGALIYKFAKFVEWPAADAGALKTFSIGVLRDPAFARLIQRKVDGLSVHGLRVEVRSLDAPNAARGCQVVFIAPGPRADIDPALSTLASAPVLTVGSQPDFLEAGGMINFIVHEDTVRFVVNLRASQRAGLALDARLLKAAHAVERAQ